MITVTASLGGAVIPVVHNGKQIGTAMLPVISESVTLVIEDGFEYLFTSGSEHYSISPGINVRPIPARPKEQ